MTSTCHCALIGSDGHAVLTAAGRVLLTAEEPRLHGADVDRIADDLGDDAALRSVAGPTGHAALWEPSGAIAVAGDAVVVIETSTGRSEHRSLGAPIHRMQQPNDARAIALALPGAPLDATGRLDSRLEFHSLGHHDASAIALQLGPASDPSRAGAATPAAVPWAPPTPADGIELIDLEQLPDDVPAPLPIPGDPARGPDEIVLGVRCPLDHHNHPDAEYCSQCGRRMGINATAILLPGPRPPVGLLLVDDGGAIPLSTALLVGRDAGTHPEVLTGRRRGVILADDTHLMSRHHVVFDLDEWDVIATDLGSANGTVLVPTTGPETALAPHEATPLRAGDRLRIGGRELRLELHHVRSGA